MAKRAVAVRQLCLHLACFEGVTWQQRWAASGMNVDVGRLSAMNSRSKSWSMAVGFKVLAASRLIVPSPQALRIYGLPDYSALFLAMQQDPAINEATNDVIASLETSYLFGALDMDSLRWSWPPQRCGSARPLPRQPA